MTGYTKVRLRVYCIRILYFVCNTNVLRSYIDVFLTQKLCFLSSMKKLTFANTYNVLCFELKKTGKLRKAVVACGKQKFN